MSAPRATGSQVVPTGPASHGPVVARRGTGVVTWLVVIVLTVGFAAMWSIVMVHQMASAIARQGVEHLERARITFDAQRARTLDHLRVLCRVMVEDPRLKSTLATDGVDEATVADILTDLGKLRRTGFLIVLSPEGRVFAQAGAEELRGLDLSGSSPVKKAQSTTEAVAGSWVIGGKVMDLSIMSIRFGATPIAYLVVGQSVDQDMLKAVLEQTGVSVASAAGETITLSSSSEETPKSVLAMVAGQSGSFQGRAFDIDGKSYVATLSDLEETGQSRPRLIFAQSLAPAKAGFATVTWMIFAAPLLVLVAVLFAMTASRRTVIVRKP